MDKYERLERKNVDFRVMLDDLVKVIRELEVENAKFMRGSETE